MPPMLLGSALESPSRSGLGPVTLLPRHDQGRSSDAQNARARWQVSPPDAPTRPDDSRRLSDPRSSPSRGSTARHAQLHVREHRTVHAFSRPGRELMRFPRAGLAARAPLAHDGGSVAAGAPVRARPRTSSGGASVLASANSESSKGAAICDPPASPRFRRLPSMSIDPKRRVGPPESEPAPGRAVDAFFHGARSPILGRRHRQIHRPPASRRTRRGITSSLPPTSKRPRRLAGTIPDTISPAAVAPRSVSSDNRSARL
jgi:hypothetical protein